MLRLDIASSAEAAAAAATEPVERLQLDAATVAGIRTRAMHSKKHKPVVTRREDDRMTRRRMGILVEQMRRWLENNAGSNRSCPSLRRWSQRDIGGEIGERSDNLEKIVLWDGRNRRSSCLLEFTSEQRVFDEADDVGAYPGNRYGRRERVTGTCTEGSGEDMRDRTEVAVRESSVERWKVGEIHQRQIEVQHFIDSDRRTR